MLLNKLLGGALLQLVVGAAHMTGVVYAAAPCKAPRYIVAAEHRDPVDQQVGYMHVSVAAGDFTRANLICIVETIRESRSSNAPLMVMFFASTAAVEEMPDLMTSPGVNGRVRAVYVLQPEKPHERLTLTPLGYGGGVLSDDPTAPEMYDDGCKDALDGRCLLACDVLGDEADAFSGSVVLSARVQKAGTFDQVRILNEASNNTIPASTIARVAVKNLKTLWFEPADRERRVRVTYRFGVWASSSPDSDFAINYSPYHAVRIQLTK